MGARRSIVRLDIVQSYNKSGRLEFRSCVRVEVAVLGPSS